jgi:hypothetical protein
MKGRAYRMQQASKGTKQCDVILAAYLDVVVIYMRPSAPSHRGQEHGHWAQGRPESQF